MPRIARAVIVNIPHHITQRGNNKQYVFQFEKDYLHYLNLLNIYKEKYALKIWAYCLMGNHVHFIAVPMKQDSFARTFNVVQMKYAQYINRKKESTGHLWQGRFFSCALEEKHLYAAIRYVEKNPVRAGIVKDPHEYEWSSAKAHVQEFRNQFFLWIVLLSKV